MKIAYLEAGPLLDYWVAMAAGYYPSYQADSAGGLACASASVTTWMSWCRCHHWGISSSTNQGDAGPITEWKEIDLAHDFHRR